jgi:hypothetical protein
VWRAGVLRKAAGVQSADNDSATQGEQQEKKGAGVQSCVFD